MLSHFKITMRPGHPGRAAGFYDGWWLKEQNHVMDTSFFETRESSTKSLRRARGWRSPLTAMGCVGRPRLG